MTVNPICGRSNCKYKVPHEHVRFLEPVDLYQEAYNHSFKDPHSPEAIEKSLRALPCQDDPSATRLETPPWTLALDQKMSAILTNTTKLFVEATHAKIQADTNHGVYMATFSSLLKRKEPLDLWQTVMAMLIGSAAGIGLVIVVVAAVIIFR